MSGDSVAYHRLASHSLWFGRRDPAAVIFYILSRRVTAAFFIAANVARQATISGRLGATITMKERRGE